MPPPSTSLLPRLTITPTGSLGVKTTDPTESLDVVGNAVISGTVIANGLTIGNAAAANANAAVLIHAPATFTAPVTLAASFATPLTGHAANLGALHVTPTGAVGIGTTAPSAALDVATGGLSVAGAIRAAGSIAAVGPGAGFVGDGAGLTGFAASARTDTTDAANITSGTLATARLPSQLPAAVAATAVGIGRAPVAGGGGGGAAAPRLDIVGEALTMLPCPMPPGPMTGPVSAFRAADIAAQHLAGTYTASASTEAPETAAWFALDDEAATVWQSVADYAPAYRPSPGTGAPPVTTRDDQNALHSGHYIQLAVPATATAPAIGAATGYELTAATAFTAPASWVLLGSVNGNAWSVLDDHSVAAPLTPGVPARFGIRAAGAGAAPAAGFSIFRLVIRETAGGNPATPARAGLAGFRLTTTRGVQLSVPLSVTPAGSPNYAAGLFVAPDGAVGIGTTAPTTGFDVAAAAGAPRFGALGRRPDAPPALIAADAGGTLTTLPYSAATLAELVHAVQTLTERLERLEQRQ